MTLFELFKKLSLARVKLSLENGELSLSAPKGAVPPSLLEVIKSHKNELIEHLKRTKSRASRIVRTERQDKDLIPLSFPQHRMWFIDKLQGGSVNYNTPMAFKVEGKFNVAVAEQALQAIVDRHEILRTIYQETDDGVVQCIEENVVCPFRQVDLRHLEGKKQQDEVNRIIQEDANQDFILNKDVIFRASWLFLGSFQSVLLLNVHHIAFDGWSMGVLIKEFMHFYQSFEADLDSSLPDLPIQYADFALWQNKYLQSDEYKKQLDYWMKQLCEAPIMHSLPLDFKRAAEPSQQGREVKGQMSAEQAVQLMAIGREKGATPFMLVHAVLSLVLSRHSNSADILLGTPVANRTLTELEPLIGYFSNTIVLRTNTENCVTFDDYLKHIKSVNLAAQTHQDVPFEQLVGNLNVVRSSQHNPLFQIMLSMDTNEKDIRAISGLHISSIDRGEVVAKFDLQINVQVTSDGIYFSWIYDKGLFLRETIETMNIHLQRLMSNVIAAPDAAISDLSMLTDTEREFLIHKLNNTTANEYKGEKLLQELFEEQAERSPEKIAVVVGDVQLSYQALNEASNQLAHYLREQGVQTDTLVGVCFEQCPEMLISILGILKAGGAYVALDSKNPPARLRYILEDTGITQVLTQSGVLDGVNLPNSIQVIDLKSMSNLKRLKLYPTLNLGRIGSQNNTNLAYVIYTSGSTGQPKGVMIEHKGLQNLAEEMQAWNLFEPAMDKDKAWGWCASFAFDASLQAVLQVLYGRMVVLLPSAIKLNPEEVANWITQNNIGVMDCTPSLLELWFNAGIADALPNLVIGGEAISEELWTRLRAWQVNGCRAWNVYGPTECTVNTTYCRVAGTQTHIGRPLNNVQVYLLDDKLQLAPYGAVAELYVGGVGLARGYLNQPELTKQRFVKNPFTKNKTARMYRTGDLVRYLPTGNLQFEGRIDDQVKVRGFRIELGEIEQVATLNSQIKSCIVDVCKAAKQIRLYVVPVEMATSENEFIHELRQWLKSKLPEYMIPAAIIILDEFPLTTNGKIDKKLLPLPDMAVFQDNYVAPQSDIELQIVAIWSELLSIDGTSISTQANFFDVGGHSLLAVKLASRLNSTFDMAEPILIRSVFEFQQISEQAALITGAIKTTNSSYQISEILSRDVTGLETVYFVPGVAAMATTFLDIAKQSKGLFNVRAFNHRGLLPDSAPFESIRENANFYVEHLLQQQSEGPYFLAGHSYGGAIVLEMVHELARRGHQAKLILMDTYFEQSEWRKQNNLEPQVLTQEQSPEINAETRIEALAIMYPTLSMEEIVELDLSNQGDQVFFDSLTNLFTKQSRLFSEYKPLQGLNVEILNLVASESDSLAFIGRKQVSSLTSENVIHKVIEGDHYSMLVNSGSKEICSMIALFITQEPELLLSDTEGVRD
ncbi:non-ribosomal peptide synthetase [Pseudoalteromonas prydzensis]|uniref:non-ribosomal peptide synthetase n=1 Tax=Pseudoalteromonas prydzensis TaxID=182141 RepID=UPI0007E51EC2|nr:non-ribosomal peptide synthetase [Pseudoalteromonas prydzensis]MBE0377188.1 hypothetical protein [Pseudoalteromonas prydzensis ACAM 620]